MRAVDELVLGSVVAGESKEIGILLALSDAELIVVGPEESNGDSFIDVLRTDVGSVSGPWE